VIQRSRRRAYRAVLERGRLNSQSAGAPERIDGMARGCHRARRAVAPAHPAAAHPRGHRRGERRHRAHPATGASCFEEFCRIAVEQGEFVLARIIEFDRDGSARIAASTEPIHACFQRWWTLTPGPRTRTACLPWAARSGKRHFRDSPTTRGQEPHRLDPRRQLRAGAAAGGARRARSCIVVLRSREAGSSTRRSRLLTNGLQTSRCARVDDKQDASPYLALYDSLTGLPNARCSTIV